MKVKKNKIIKIVFIIIAFGGLIFFVLNHPFERKITILDCEGVYYKKLFEKQEPGYLEVDEDNAKVDVAICLCEKYMKKKDSLYKKEILRLYYEPFGGMRKTFSNPSKNIDSICKYRKDVFTKMYNL